MLGTLQIETSKDAMAAYAYILPEGDTEITIGLLREELQKKGIRTGIQEETLKRLVEEASCETKYLVAQGMAPVRGTDGYYEYFFPLEEKECVPTIRKDGSVDYSPVIKMVKQGDKLAEYHPARQGRAGYTIFEASVAPFPAKEGERLKCINVEQRGTEYYAMLDGRVSLKDRKLEVKGCLLIDGDAGYSLGDIHFNGDVHVLGDVLTDVTITAGGSIEVDGVVEGAKLIAAKNILVRRGVHGKDKAVLEAGKSLTANFVEGAKSVKAGRDLLVDYIINTEAIAGQKICATGKKGMLLGGRIIAGECIEAMQIGNDTGIKTQLILKSDEAATRQKGRIIVHFKAYEGTSANLYGCRMDELAMTAGEVHFTEFGIERCAIGTFRRKQQTEEKQENRKLILLVDDDPVILKTEYAYLSRDYQVVAVSSARDALLFLNKKLPDLILLDYLMPKMNGGELLERIRSSENYKCAAIPVFFVTSVTDKETMKRCLKLYPQGYLMKPVGKEELLKIIADFFQKNRV